MFHTAFQHGSNVRETVPRARQEEQRLPFQLEAVFTIRLDVIHQGVLLLDCLLPLGQVRQGDTP